MKQFNWISMRKIDKTYKIYLPNILYNTLTNQSGSSVSWFLHRRKNKLSTKIGWKFVIM